MGKTSVGILIIIDSIEESVLINNYNSLIIINIPVYINLTYIL